MQRAIAKQAEAERVRRAMIVQAESERQTAEELARAAEVLTKAPGGLTVRVLRALPDVAQQGSLVVFPLPVELAALLGRFAEAAGGGKDRQDGSEP